MCLWDEHVSSVLLTWIHCHLLYPHWAIPSFCAISDNRVRMYGHITCPYFGLVFDLMSRMPGCPYMSIEAQDDSPTPLLSWCVAKNWTQLQPCHLVLFHCPFWRWKFCPNPHHLCIYVLHFCLGSSYLAQLSPEMSSTVSPKPLSLLRVQDEQTDLTECFYLTYFQYSFTIESFTALCHLSLDPLSMDSLSPMPIWVLVMNCPCANQKPLAILLSISINCKSS